MKMANTVGLVLASATLAALDAWTAAYAAPLPGGTLDPLTVPKYVMPLRIPGEMPAASTTTTTTTATSAKNYSIEMVQITQQILPTTTTTGVTIPKTKVWTYAAVGNSDTRSYPAFTVEANKNSTINVNWYNNLKNSDGYFLPHLVPVDQTLHWANPPRANACVDANGNPTPNLVKDCRTLNGALYTGPVPMVPHLHGAHTGPESDGYPEAWFLPKAKNVDCTKTYSCLGSQANTYGTANTSVGSAAYVYPNTQPSTTLWYHDHTLGMTRANVYAGPAGFWLIRDSAYKTGETGLVSGALPKPAPKVGDKSGTKYYEIPLVIQDRSFNADGSLFYPDNRAFFEGLTKSTLPTPLIGDGSGLPSDISPIWNPETFFNVMVVNGSSWPSAPVDPRRYRFRILNGTNARALNLALFVVDPVTGQTTTQEVPIYQIGSDQGLLPNVVKITTGFTSVLPGDGTVPAPVAADAPERALLLSPAERADVIVDFNGLAKGTHVRMVNTAPDSPFGGFNGTPAADPSTTGQVMEFVVGAAPTTAEASTAPQNLKLTAFDTTYPALPQITNVRQVTLNEASSAAVCVTYDPTGVISSYIPGVPVSNPYDEAKFASDCAFAGGTPMGPKEALLGVLDSTGVSVPKMWADGVTENPALGSTEQWDITNFTEDAHPVHVHLVHFKVLNRQLAVGSTGTAAHPVAPSELGWKDTVVSYPGEITSVAATFDTQGLYVWHCHILEHEDNEMMRPMCVGNPSNCPL